MESGIEREILRIEREMEQLKLDVRTLTSFRQPSLEQQLANLWYNPSGCSGTIVLTSTPTTWVIGSNLFTATLSGNCGVPTGTVSFYLDGVLQGSPATISGGVATASFSITSGTHTVLAVYSGDFTYSSGQASLTQTITSSTINFCGCAGVPTTLFLYDSEYTLSLGYSKVTMTWDNVSSFTGSALYLTRPTLRTSCIHYKLFCSGGFPAINETWESSGGVVVINTCPGSPNTTQPWGFSAFQCTPYDMTFTIQGGTNYNQIYPSSAFSLEVKTA